MKLLGTYFTHQPLVTYLSFKEGIISFISSYFYATFTYLDVVPHPSSFQFRYNINSLKYLREWILQTWQHVNQKHKLAILETAGEVCFILWLNKVFQPQTVVFIVPCSMSMQLRRCGLIPDFTVVFLCDLMSSNNLLMFWFLLWITKITIHRESRFAWNKLPWDTARPKLAEQLQKAIRAGSNHNGVVRQLHTDFF